MKAVSLDAGTPCQLQASGSPGSPQVTPTLTRLAATPSPQRSAQRRPQSFRIEALSPASAASSSPGTPSRFGGAPAAALPLTPANTNARRGAHTATSLCASVFTFLSVTPASRALLWWLRGFTGIVFRSNETDLVPASMGRCLSRQAGKDDVLLAASAESPLGPGNYCKQRNSPTSNSGCAKHKAGVTQLAAIKQGCRGRSSDAGSKDTALTADQTVEQLPVLPKLKVRMLLQPSWSNQKCFMQSRRNHVMWQAW